MKSTIASGRHRRCVGLIEVLIDVCASFFPCVLSFLLVSLDRAWWADVVVCGGLKKISIHV